MISQNWVLLIDPFRNLTNAYRMILEDENFGVDTASSLTEASRLFPTRNYSAVLTEFFPPPEDTCQIIGRMKEKQPEIYIIMVTSITIEEGVYKKLFAAGLDDLILKPYSPGKILVHIRKGLRQRELILKKQELEKQNVFDPSSLRAQKNIFNQVYFKKCLRQELKKAKRHDRPLSLILIKIPPEMRKKDPFDIFCDEMARVIRTYIREEDIVGRENGSFEILLPETDKAGSRALLQRLSDLIQAHPSFRSDDALRSFLPDLSFQAFTYPEMGGVPRSLGLVLEEINQETSQN